VKYKGEMKAVLEINKFLRPYFQKFWDKNLNRDTEIAVIENFYDENLGLDIRIINEQDVAEYKLEHICRKLQEWFRSEIESVSYQIISEEERTLKAKIYITHKEHNDIEKEVIISEI